MNLFELIFVKNFDGEHKAYMLANEACFIVIKLICECKATTVEQVYSKIPACNP